MAKLNIKPYQKSVRIAGQMEDFLLDPELEFEVVEPKGTNIYDTVAKIKVNEVLKRSNSTQVGSLREVLKYKTALKWSLFPLKAKSKKPRIQWQQYTKEPASDWQLGEWWTKYPDSNVAAITGSISNLIVIDIDEESAFDLLKEQGGGTNDRRPRQPRGQHPRPLHPAVQGSAGAIRGDSGHA